MNSSTKESSNMWKVTTEKFKKPKEGGAYLSERTRIVPGRHIHPRTVLVDLSKVDKDTATNMRKIIEKNKGKVVEKKGKEPIDYGVTKEQFYEILDKASQPIKKPETRSKNS
jgi:hypothetical protein